ncbi:MAG: Asp-tRNA(Asn)/Glu-tRNA(Gln) amidotransferase subunit GatC [Clostridia bacterium]|nr:Asp-tRNA(Asn)/Glu-tRNA(Gln) amidotransferase subunit GatC [Clostridia bacterium]
MDREILRRLELLNQLALTEEEKEAFLSFYAAREAGWDALNAVDTSDTERMVHVMPIPTVVRADVAYQPFTREQLQAAAPDAGEGHWRVPRVVE